MKILLTGSTGFIGSNLLKGLHQTYDMLAPSSRELNLLDQCAVSFFFRKHAFDAVIHCATWNPKSNPHKDWNTILEKNLRMYFNLAREKDRYGKLICLGTGADCSRPHCPPLFNEDVFEAHIPEDAYGFSKYVMTQHIAYHSKSYNLRLFGVFGQGEDWRFRFISNAICSAMYDLPISIMQDVRFDYLYVNDLVNIVNWFLLHDPKMKTYNVCTGRTYLLSELAKIILEVLGKDLHIDIALNGQGAEYSGDIIRLKSEIESLHFTPMRQAISELSYWYLEHLNQVSVEEVKANNLALKKSHTNQPTSITI